MGDLTLDTLMLAGPNAPIEDPYSLYADLRATDPVSRRDFQGRASFFVSRFDDVHTVLREDERFSSRSNGDRGIAFVMGRTIIGMDGREHLRHRKIITPVLAPRALRGDFPKLVEQIAHEIIDGFADRGHADLVSEFTYVYPMRVFTEILGLDPTNVRQFHDWAIDLSHVTSDPARGIEASGLMKEYLAPIVSEQRVRPRDGLIGKLATVEIEGERLTDEEVISFVRLLVIAGAETTYHLLGSTLFALLSDRELLERVQRDRSLIEPVLDETLRWESPVQVITREASEDTEIEGVAIPAGSDVIVGIGSANRDERRFPDPERFDPARGGEPHIAFGFGKHFCAGSRFALLEATVGLSAVLDRLPGLHFDSEAEQARIVGVAFRGPDRLPVIFER